MQFENQYLKYAEYIDLGGELEEMPFNLLELEAQKILDLRTQFRLKNETNIPNEVKLCIFKLIDKINSFNKSTNTSRNLSVASENIDGYSVTYLTGDEINQIINSKHTELDDIIRDYLFGIVVNNVPLLYLGVV